MFETRYGFEPTSHIESRLNWYFKYELTNAVYITFDTDDNMYVCDGDDCAIYQVSADNFEISRRLLKFSESPASILFNPIHQTVTVGFQNCENVHVYQFL